MQTVDAVKTLVLKNFGVTKVEVAIGSKVPKTVNLRGPVDQEVEDDVLILSPNCEETGSPDVLIRVPAGTIILCENSQCVQIDNVVELQF